MPSITTWTRLEPQTGPTDLADGYAARVYDPLWMLARQWQLGEFQAQDAGTPIVARWRARIKPLNHFQAGLIPWNTMLTAPTFDPDAVPLQTLVERQPTHQASIVEGLNGLRLAVDTGQYFLRLLALATLSRDYRPDFVAAFAVAPLTAEQRAAVDPQTAAFADLVAGRAVDGRRLRTGFGATDDDENAHLLPGPPPPPEDEQALLAAFGTWLAWSASLFSEPDEGAQAWQPERLEYDFTLSTKLGEDQFGERPLSAEQYTDGAFDWYTCDLNLNINTGTSGDPPGTLVARTVVPAPVTFQGMPAQRFWELEDARIDLGTLQPGAVDLPQILLIETLTGFSNDWYVVPIELPVGSVVESTSLVVTDTFGMRTLLRPAGDPHTFPSTGNSMYRLSMPVDPGVVGIASSNLFFLPPTVVPLPGPVLEEVMLLRDEMANVAWAIERRLESPLEEGLETARDIADLADAPPAPADVPVYRLASPIPEHWIPLLPVRPDPDKPEVRLARGAILRLDGTPAVVAAQAQTLRAADPSARLLLREEEVPREGVVIRRAYQAARWHDGRLFLWASNKVSVGRGEASSGLAYDALEG